jgi:hypothetical protein
MHKLFAWFSILIGAIQGASGSPELALWMGMIAILIQLQGMEDNKRD